jgi:presenilin-like A22 family membrane protease
MLGIGDGFLPAALAVGAGTFGTATQIGVFSATLPQLTTAAGGIIGLALLMWADLPKAIAALIVSVPGALVGLGLGLLVEYSLF